LIKLTIYIALLLILSVDLWSQSDTLTNSRLDSTALLNIQPHPLSPNQKDSVKVENMQPQQLNFKEIDSILNSKEPEKIVKSPTGAIWRSLALPGWGQYYVGSYWKSPIFLAGWGTVIFFIYDMNSKYQTASDDYDLYNGTDLYEKDLLYRTREYYRDYRDLNVLYLVGIYIISAVDAYVGANLYDFNVDDNLSVDYRLNRFGNVELNITYKFK
jgi:hypothetical protein